uniref:Uncharacterized protein n=1 Tax=Anguilla anguilla TaxID=7936 RepID=A0A0E9VHA7_ANGAN
MRGKKSRVCSSKAFRGSWNKTSFISFH